MLLAVTSQLYNILHNIASDCYNLVDKLCKTIYNTITNKCSYPVLQLELET